MKRWLPYPLLASVVTAVLFFLAKLPIGVSALIAFLGWPILGTLVTSDDDLPGGWSNPDGTATPIWETFLFWGSLCGGAAVVCLAFAVQVGFALQWLGWLASFGLGFAALSAYLLYRSRDDVHA